ncbi:type II secretory pathway predicted ATPase ExeA [Natronocella acetinitrilica]|jgi:general secretion pathway protein A|uniref:Type II secretory pathway predicted ATPase ExeA n=1 Tax=Natronocella acetinitrilica TaxID=414046 RepID=A0AAE3KCI8_9GAMM|nr:AAA family ATPase [Natronocella acetinitrilica]MCP1675816.1 type II secretory pathway predicted ATPase ExeA [Natronocella acetinitrilica]
MYLKHFGLSDYPFRLTPDPDYLYRSSGYALARAYVDYSLMTRDGLVVITGDVGAGKTTLMKKILEDKAGDAVLVHLEQTQLTPVEFLQAVYQRLTGTPGSDSKVTLTIELSQALRKLALQGRLVILCVDEAQALSFEVLEEIRFLTALEYDKLGLISVILMGQPELRDVLESPRMEQLRQRVRLHFHLSGLTVEEVSAYVLHRLGISGSRQPERLIADDAWPIIHRYTGGIPRLVNTLCDRAFLRALLAGKRFLRGVLFQETIEELGWKPYDARRTQIGEQRPRGTTTAPAVLDPTSLADAVSKLDERLAGLEAQLARVADALDRDGEQVAVRRREAS